MAEDTEENKEHKEEATQNESAYSSSGKETDRHSGQVNEEGKASDSASNDSEKAEIDFGLSAVAESPKKSMITMAIIVLLIGGLAYYFFFSGAKAPKAPASPTDIPTNIIANSDNGEVPIPSIPNSPVAPPVPTPPPATPPKVEPQPKPKEPTPSEPKPPAPAAPSGPNQALLNQEQAAKLKAQQEAAQREKQRITANIMVKHGGDTNAKTKANTLAASGNFTPQQTSSTQQQITKVGTLSNIITQGKIIDAVLESSIISSSPGPVRALVTQDVYSDKGENVLIQKGSRLIGTFSSGYAAGQSRVMITWNRLIMPNGYDIAVGSPSAGLEGILGVEGDVHTEFTQTLANALLLSTLNISFAKIAEKLTNTGSNSTTTTTNNSNGQTTTTTSNPTQQAVGQATQNMGNIVQSYIQDNFVVKPYISIAHGTRVKVFVNKDLLFPANTIGGVDIIQ